MSSFDMQPSKKASAGCRTVVCRREAGTTWAESSCSDSKLPPNVSQKHFTAFGDLLARGGTNKRVGAILTAQKQSLAPTDNYSAAQGRRAKYYASAKRKRPRCCRRVAAGPLTTP